MADVEVRLPPKLVPVFLGEADVRGAYGGRGSAKTRSFALMAAIRGAMWAQQGDTGLIVCGRQFQNSIEDSSLSEVQAAIQEVPWLSDRYEVGDRYVKSRDGRIEFSFIGLERNRNSIKSKSRVRLFWADEAEDVAEEAWEKIIPTVREEGSEIWLTWNPEDEDSATNRRFRLDPPTRSKIVELNWRDNPWFPETLNRKRLDDQQKRPDTYAHIWEGAFRSAVGIIFKRDWFKHYDVLPSRLNLYIAGDFAVSQDENDHTEFGVWGLSDSGDLYAVDWWFGQTDPAEWIDAYLGLISKHRPRVAFEEKGVILRAVDSAITKRMRETQTFVRRESLVSAGSKAERALGFAARASAGAVYLPRTPWALRLLNQLCAFNGEEGRQDDAVDVCSLVGRGLDFMANASKPAAPQAPPRRRDYGFGQPTTDNWKTV